MRGKRLHPARIRESGKAKGVAPKRKLLPPLPRTSLPSAFIRGEVASRVRSGDGDNGWSGTPRRESDLRRAQGRARGARGRARARTGGRNGCNLRRRRFGGRQEPPRGGVRAALARGGRA